MPELSSQSKKSQDAQPRMRGRKPDPHGREKILTAAAVAFMERGYTGTSVDDIAGAIEATKGFIYGYYASKADIYFAVQESALQKIDDAVRRELKVGGRPDVVLTRMAYVHVMEILSNFAAAKVGVQGLERSLMRSAGEKERLNLKRNLRARDKYEKMFGNVITLGIKEGIFRDGSASLLTKGFLGALNWVTLWFNPNRPTSLAKTEEIARSLSDFAVSGLRK